MVSDYLASIIKHFGIDMRTALRTINWDEVLTIDSEPSEGPIVFKDDPIAMACASYRLGQQGGYAWLDLHAATVEPRDRDTAADIRRYYADRLLVTALKSNGTMSEFRRKLYGVVTGNYQLKKSEEGLLYRLPYFYAEDTGLDHVMSQTQSVSIVNNATAKIAGKFTLVKKIFCSRANAGSHWQFWFVRETSHVPYLVEIKDDNVLYKLFDTLTQQPQMFQAGTTHFKHHRGHYRDRVYIRMTQVDLA
jgi:hypothetical protein